MKRMLNKKLPMVITCWLLIIGMVLTASPAFSRDRSSSHDRDRTYDSDRSRDRDRSHNRYNSNDRNRYYNRNRSYVRYNSRRNTHSRSVTVIRRNNVIPAIIATGIVAGVTFSLLDNNNNRAPAPCVTSPPACPANAGMVTGAGSVMVTVELLNIRSGPGLSRPCVGRLHRGATLSILGTSGVWYHVQTSGGVSGWVMSQYTSPVTSAISG